MKEYPSIPRYNKDFPDIKIFTFDKIDGSNLRFEWNKKRGWYKYGTRNHLFDSSDETFGCAIDIFLNNLGESLSKISYDNKWESIVAFTEFWGNNSFAGIHNLNDEKHLTLIDVDVYKQGILSPKYFLNYFSELNIPNYLGEIFWDESFIEDVRNSKIKEITFEGVVGKYGERHSLKMIKLKTKAWINKVLQKYGNGEQGKSIINS